jgi:hypothetical protein
MLLAVEGGTRSGLVRFSLQLNISVCLLLTRLRQLHKLYSVCQLMKGHLS